jgi:uncharacterized protein YbjT (DUF2867 family)
MKDDRIILVTGATGRQGGAVARELLARGHRVRAMTRKPDSDKAQGLADLGAQVVRGDFDDPKSLPKAIKGAWGAFAVHDSWEAGVEREQEQGKRFARLCKEAGVSHYVYSSVGSAHRRTGIPHFESKWHIEETIRQLDLLSYTVIRPVFFMENFLSPGLLPDLKAGKITMPLKPTTVLQMIAVEDIGRYVAWAFENYESLNGRAIDIAGDERTMPDTARILGAAADKEIEFAPRPIEEVRAASEDWAIMVEWFDAVGYDADIAALAGETGIRPITLTEWAAAVDWPRYVGGHAVSAQARR